MKYYREKKNSDILNPIDCIEDIIYRYDLNFLRDTPNDLSIKFKGLWINYNVNFNWNAFSEILFISNCLEIPQKKKINKNIFTLLSFVNKKVSLGYFDYCEKSQSIFFNYKISTKGFRFLSPEQIEDYIDVVIKESDKFFPTFYVFMNKKQDPVYALEASLIDTYGEA